MMDKRREPRIDASWPVQVAGLFDTGTGRTVNVSLCGVLFTSDLELRKGDLVLVRMSLDRSTNVDAAAQIMRVDNLPEGTAYAADYRHISAADRQKLSFALLLLLEPSLGGSAG